MSSATTTLIPTGTWTADTAHSTLGFSVKHLGIATVRGSFDEFEGKLEIGDDITSAKITGSAKVDSINTSEPQRDAHLKSPDFFDAENNPELTFTSTAIRPTGDDSFEIVGDLTMHGITKPVTLKAEVQGSETDRGATSASAWRSRASSTAPSGR